MEQLLDIVNVPISFEVKIHNAKLEIANDGISQQGIVDFTDLTPYTSKLYFDTHEFRNKVRSTAMKNHTELSAYEERVLAAMSGTADLAKKGKSLMNAQNDTGSLGALAFQHIQPTIQSTIGIPSSPADINWDPQQFSTQYETDRKNYDWLTKNKPKLKFTPAKVEFLVKEYAHVEFKYLGKPQYVPPSASPDYQPPEMDVTA
ncbi:DUF6470 family protein [Caproiciproducens faecalis]|uniref:Uncharacterized protein n=1 Tax=Caproiciproducens faecalis TaxID=2820301 RepID=A0ABS7DPW8_9FIRM|nr:DUF6470 family protein [Caproiciproducens faecalis]MBW7573340.1 hypothetical protein [Caproiciproducens faecalis]